MQGPKDMRYLAIAATLALVLVVMLRDAKREEEMLFV
jgi:hypothetical protein